MAITTGQWGMIALMFVVACAPLVVFLIRLALKLRAQSKASSTVAVDATANYTPPGNGLQQAKQAAALVSFGVQGGAAAVGWLFMVFGLWSNDPPDEAFSSLLDEVFASAEFHLVTFPNPYTGSESSNTIYLAYKA